MNNEDLPFLIVLYVGVIFVSIFISGLFLMPVIGPNQESAPLISFNQFLTAVVGGFLFATLVFWIPFGLYYHFKTWKQSLKEELLSELKEK